MLASLLPADADRERFLHVLEIHGDPVAARRAVDRARRTGIRVKNPYDYDRAFGYCPDTDDRNWVKALFDESLEELVVLDPTAGGGSIPFETSRLGIQPIANDLNPVAALILKATVEWPQTFSADIVAEFNTLARKWRTEIEARLGCCFTQLGLPECVDLTYLWARTNSPPSDRSRSLVGPTSGDARARHTGGASPSDRPGR